MLKSKKIRFILSILYLLFVYFIFFVGCRELYFLNFSYDLLFIFSLFNLFVLLHLFVNISKLYEFIYEKRYLIGILFLFFLVLFKYNGSSVECWDKYIEPEYKISEQVILGVVRPIRSDEWLVSTPFILSQATDRVKFSSNNTLLSARDNLVTLFPNLPSFDISMLSMPNFVGFLFLDSERAFSLYWYLPYFVLFFSTFEMFMIITKKKKFYSLVGTIMITLSPVVQWWQSPIIPGYGALAVTLFYYFVCSNSRKKKFFLSILFGYSGYLYIMCLYPAWQVPYGYVYLILLIYIIFSNKKKIRKSDLLYLIPVFIIIGVPLYIIFKQNYDVLTIVSSTVYPGARMSFGGGEWQTIFTYVIDIFFPYKRGIYNPCELVQYFSLFPIPSLYSLYLIKKQRKGKKDLFLVMSCIVLISFSIWELFPLPSIISRLSLLYMSTELRVQSTMGYLSILQIIYVLSHYETLHEMGKKLNLKKMFLLFVSIISIFVTIKISNGVIEKIYPSYVNLFTSLVCLIFCSIIVYLFLYNNKKSNLFLCLILIFISIISGIIVLPINKGLSVIYDKPLAKQIRKMVKENGDAVFIATDSNFILSNYLVANGARTINTTNQVPNFDLYYKIDPERRYDHIYNRYHHLSVSLIDDKTNFSLIAPDSISLNINYDDLCITGADYIVSTNQNLSLYDRYEHVYGEYGANIYKTNCKNS